MIDWKKVKQHKWVVAVSGGADSMALLAMCLQHNVEVVCTHVNYQKRDSANRDMEGVKQFCLLHNIPCFIHMVQKQEYMKKQNFQALARDIRYRFFRECMVESNAYGVLVAHHMDDVIETYMMQEKRKSIPSFYGIAPVSEMNGMHIHRLLLQYTKQQLKNYCEQEKITFYEDESNASDDYTRNQIRHKYVDKLNIEQKHAIIKEIGEKNKALSLQKREVLRIVDAWGSCITTAMFESVEKTNQEAVLREWILRNTKLREVHQRNISILVAMLLKNKTNFTHPIKNNYYLQVSYGKITVEQEKEEGFSYVYDTLTYESTKYFSLAKQGEKIEGVQVHKSDFPITVRNAQKGDKIVLRMGTKKVSRMFIDNKVSHNERKLWPVVVNCKGIVIFVHKIGCDIEHYSNKSNLFVLK